MNGAGHDGAGHDGAGPQGRGARTAQGMRAPDAEKRLMPESARCQRAHDARRRDRTAGQAAAQRRDLTSASTSFQPRAVAPFCAPRSCRAVWHHAPLGIMRGQAFRALRHPAPSCRAPLLPAPFLVCEVPAGAVTAVRPSGAAQSKLACFVPCSAVCSCLLASCRASRRRSSCSPGTACATSHASRD